MQILQKDTVLWMKVAPTNHNPEVIARYYLEIVEEVGGI